MQEAIRSTLAPVSDEELTDPAYRDRNADLRRWRTQFPDTVAIDAAAPRQRSRVVGVVHMVRLVPDRGLDITVEDGSTHRLTASWTGRTRLPGVELGAGLILNGTVAQERDGSRRMRNPEYALVAGPYAG